LKIRKVRKKVVKIDDLFEMEVAVNPTANERSTIK
tara:strand:- start:6649 stop:6753 length:105 start_codon:yes stop_codon:yes gene_type:complete